ncbi:thermonuclease NucI [Staphylococcus auricularis]|uniref:thermonuclease NucI n=1 Tax=Staphylococcus auricularis TaxID=29379 RepID=UPI003EBD0C1C
MKGNKKLAIIVVTAIVILVLGFQFLNQTGPFKFLASSTSDGPYNTEKVHVERVVDGDTFIAQDESNQHIKVRLIGIDTPETVKPNTPVQPYGKEASKYTKSKLTNKDVYLEYDKEKEDRYGRRLAYVWLDKETLYNEQLVKEGLAREKYFAPNGKYRAVFQQAEQQAKSGHKNLWS